MLASVLTSQKNILFLCYGFSCSWSVFCGFSACFWNSHFPEEDLEVLCHVLQVNALGNKSFFRAQFLTRECQRHNEERGSKCLRGRVALMSNLLCPGISFGLSIKWKFQKPLFHSPPQFFPF